MFLPEPALSNGPKVATRKLTRRLRVEEEKKKKWLITITAIRAALTTR